MRPGNHLVVSNMCISSSWPGMSCFMGLAAHAYRTGATPLEKKVDQRNVQHGLTSTISAVSSRARSALPPGYHEPCMPERDIPLYRSLA